MLPINSLPESWFNYFHKQQSF